MSPLPSTVPALSHPPRLLLADGGDAALSAFEHSPSHLLPFDVVMTGIGGFETCRRLRALAHGRQLKIDRRFVVDMDSGDKEGALVAAIVTPVRRLNMQVVAEGVQTPSQAAAPQRRGCHLHQGDLYARPMPAQAYEALQADRPVLKTFFKTAASH